jgi:hypothetical protein
VPPEDPLLTLIARAYDEWQNLRSRGETAHVLIEGVADGAPVKVTARAAREEPEASGFSVWVRPSEEEMAGRDLCAMEVERDQVVAGIVLGTESIGAWIEGPDDLTQYLVDLRSDDDDRDIIEFALEDEEDPERRQALQRHLDHLDGPATPAEPASEDAHQLADGLVRAILAGVEASGIEAPFVIDHRGGGGDSDDAFLPGFVRVGSAAFRDAMRAAVSRDGAAVEQLFKGSSQTGVATFQVADFCDAETLGVVDQVNAAQSLAIDLTAPEAQRAGTLADAAADEVVRRLNAPGVVPGAADSFQMMSSAGRRFADDRAGRSERVLGSRAVADFATSITSLVNPADAELRDIARTDRDALARALAARGIDNADALVRAHAGAALRLEAAPDESTQPGAILHGRGLLPPGEPWPRSAGGRALAFLAALDLSRLRPTLDGASPLPEAGWMLFYADVDDPTGYDPARWEEPQEEPEGWSHGEFYGEPTRNAPGANARMFFVPPGSTPIAGDPPGLRGSHGSAEQRRTAREQLILPDGWGTGEALGLSPAHAEAYDEIAQALRFPPGIDAYDDFVLGALTGVQGEGPAPGEVLLLHLASVEFQDGGIVQFRIPAAALAEQDWAEVYAVADSG